MFLWDSACPIGLLVYIQETGTTIITVQNCWVTDWRRKFDQNAADSFQNLFICSTIMLPLMRHFKLSKLTWNLMSSNIHCITVLINHHPIFTFLTCWMKKHYDVTNSPVMTKRKLLGQMTNGLSKRHFILTTLTASSGTILLAANPVQWFQ
jgi:hypothetical protein